MEVISELKKPWLILWDFNAITCVEEKISGKAPNRRSMLYFNTCIDVCGLIQAPKTGQQFSWSNYQYGSKRILYGLDRAMFNQLWSQHNEDWGFKVGLRIASDYAPILGEGDPAFVFQSKLKRLKNILKLWNWEVFGDVNLQIKEAEVKFQRAMEESDNYPLDEEKLKKLVEAQNDFNTKEVQKSAMLRQKARVRWIKKGDSNTNFFHTSIKIKQAQNCISEVEDEAGNITSDQKKIADILVKHFEEKFKI
ncbi:uncharacterized protein LOC113279314 [Papaver somniferum]|uniref:uncharacterized protein LOC113279314 n=1 Tax=Papaver somniferum TaxID=3469 RepID=UPI000E6F8177|nr:uncharacterized protein LOC113279314 [Papaver somniferum]